MYYNTNSGSDNIAFKLLYYWVMIGKWRRWCIPGALISLISLYLGRVAWYISRDYPIAQAYITAIFFSLIEPLRLLFYSSIFHYRIMILIALLSWFAGLGAAVGYLIGFSWKLIHEKPKEIKHEILEL